MQNIRTSLQGQKINFDQFVAHNDKTRAVGNMKVNARGDMIDASGNILKTRTEIMKQKFTGPTVSHKKNRTGKTKAAGSKTKQTVDQTISANTQTNLEIETQSSTNGQNSLKPRTLSQAERIQQFGPRASDLRGALASDIEIDLNEVTRPSEVRTLKRI